MSAQMSVEVEVGQEVTFVGLADPESPVEFSEFLEEGHAYVVDSVNEPEDDDPSVTVRVANPKFNPRKPVTEKNTEYFLVDLFEDEFEVSPAEGGEQEAGDDQPIDYADVKVGDLVAVATQDGEHLGLVTKKGRGGSLTLTIETDEGDTEMLIKGSDIEAIYPAEEAEVEVEAPEKAPEPVKPATTTKQEPGAKAETAKPAGKLVGKAKTEKKTEKKTEAKGKLVSAGKAVAKRGRPAKDAVPAEEVDEDLKGIVILNESEEDEEVLGLVRENEDTLCDMAQEMAEEAAQREFTLGGILYHVRIGKKFRQIADGAYDKVGGWNEYVEKELKIGYRKAMYLIEIYTSFSKAGVSGEVVAQIGWTKAQQIAKVLESGNAEALIEAAENSTVEELKTTISTDFAKVGADTRPKVKRTTLKFRLLEERGVLVTGYLEQAVKHFGITGKDALSEALERIITEWAVENLEVKAQQTATRTGRAVGRAAGRAQAAARA